MTYIWYSPTPNLIVRCTLISGTLAAKARVRVSPHLLQDVTGVLRPFGHGGWMVTA